jgi:hypothetical protein
VADVVAPIRTSHGRHDRFAIAEALGGGSVPATVGTCPACGQLHRDLQSIQTALRHAWTPRRHRDLRLSAADLASRRPVLWRRLLAAVGSCLDAVTRPLAVGLTGLGLAGLVLANVPAGFVGASGAAPAAAPPETAMASHAPSGTPSVDQKRDSDRLPPDPVIVLSTASLAAGGGIFMLRRIAARARAMR